MALNIKNAEVEVLAAEVARERQTTLTGAVLLALRAQKQMLAKKRARETQNKRLDDLLTRAFSPTDIVDRDTPESEILGYSEDGV